jgi:eukaryotic-like serine/threonine-protein kinase
MEAMNTKTVIDENGTVHHLRECLGEGGQGQVWLTHGQSRVVKVFPKRTNREELHRRLVFVKRLDLGNLHVARPLALLKAPDVGYVAEFLSDMAPIRSLIRPAEKQNLPQWYIKTGGIRRRLRLLAHAGEALAGLHARGLVYADVSPANIFISAPEEALEAWLIDLDNLRYEGEAGSGIYTPAYGAPELVRGQTFATPLSDAWSFAVLAFQTLTLTHPLLGDWVNEGEPELEEDALAGRLPWIEHSTDARNRASTGLNRSWIFTGKLMELARETFEKGMDQPDARPRVSKWVDRLHLAADQTLRCAKCRGTYLVNAKACVFCDAPRPSFATIRIKRWEPTKGIVEEMGTLATLPLTDEKVHLTKRHTEGESGIAAREPAVELYAGNRSFGISSASGSCWVTPPGEVKASSAIELHSRSKTLPLDADQKKSWVLHFDRVDTPHRVAIVTGSLTS